MILEKNSLVELYYCDNLSNYKDFIPELKALIENGSGLQKGGYYSYDNADQG